MLRDITGWTQDGVDIGVALATELGQFGARPCTTRAPVTRTGDTP
ncbi:hypothetical protein ACFYY9_18410 [Streptomyces nigra]